MKLRFLAVPCILAAAALAQQPAQPLTMDPVYQQNCAKCHGKDGEGHMFAGPSLVKSKKSIDDLRRIINNGKGHMPRFSGVLTDQQINTLMNEIMALRNPPQS